MSKTIKDKKSLLQLYRVSKYVYNEAFLEGSLAMQQKDRFIERMKKNSRSLKTSAELVKIASAVLIIFLSIMRTLPYKSIMLGLQQLTSLSSLQFNNYLITLSMGFAFILVFELLFLFTYGMTGMLGFFNGKAFSWLEVLPFRRREISIVTFFTFFRALNYQFISILFGLPIGVAITIGFNIHSILPILISFGISFLALVFFMGFMIIVSNFLANKIFNLSGTSKWRSVIRILVILGYVLVAGSASAIIQLSSFYAVKMIAAGQSTSIINTILSFVIFPFSLSNLLSLSFIPINSSNIMNIYPILIGFAFSILIIVLIFRKGINTLQKLTKESEVNVEKVKVSIESIKIIKKYPITAMFKKDISYIFRNVSVTMFFLMPIIIPTVVLLAFPINSMGITSIDPIFLVNFFMFGTIVFCLVFGLNASTSSEGDTGNILATLPTKSYDIYKSKRRTVFLIMSLSLIVQMIIVYIKIFPDPIIFLVDFVALAIYYFAQSELVLIFFSVFFGKLRNKYTMDNIHPDLKIIKAISGVVILYIISYATLIVTLILQMLFFFNSPQMAIYIFLGISIVIFIPIRIIAKYMFDR